MSPMDTARALAIELYIVDYEARGGKVTVEWEREIVIKLRKQSSVSDDLGLKAGRKSWRLKVVLYQNKVISLLLKQE